MDASSDPQSESDLPVDVVIVGAGISGTLAASLLARAGYTVCLIDRHAAYPPDFRAEHLDGPQIEQLRRMHFLDHLTTGLYCGETVIVARRGRVTGAARTLNYGLRYEDLVNRARAALPPNVRVVTERVASIEPGVDLQQVRMASGRCLCGRLVVLATGTGYSLCRQVGTTRQMIRAAHSLTFGFNIEPLGARTFVHSFLVYQRERIRDRIDYLAAFTMGTATRVNLFTYRDFREPWTKAFLQKPDQALAEVLPGLGAVIGPYRVTGPVVARPSDLYAAQDYKRDGVVLIGDAFQSSSPATGMGMVKLLTDIEQLCTIHVPHWLRTPRMDAPKIAQFYDDPVKRSCDAKALHAAEYRRRVSTKASLRWHTHRLRLGMMERLNALRDTPYRSTSEDDPERAQQPQPTIGVAG